MKFNVSRIAVVTALALPISTVASNPAQAEDVQFWLYNRSDVMMTQFDKSPYYLDGWEGNILNSDFQPREYANINIDGYRTMCINDLRAVFWNSTDAQKHQVTICR